MAQRNKAAFTANINTQFPTNGTGQVTAETVRTHLGADIPDSFVNKVDDTSTLQMGVTTTTGTSRTLAAVGSEANIDIIIAPKGSGTVKYAKNINTQTTDYSSTGRVVVVDSSVTSRNFQRGFGSGNQTLTADAASTTGVFDAGSAVPNNSVIVLYITLAYVKSDGTSAASILVKSTWRKASGAITKLSDKTIDSDEDLAGTLTMTTTNSGTIIQTTVTSSGGSGTFHYGTYVDAIVHSY